MKASELKDEQYFRHGGHVYQACAHTRRGLAAWTKQNTLIVIHPASSVELIEEEVCRGAVLWLLESQMQIHDLREQLAAAHDHIRAQERRIEELEKNGQSSSSHSTGNERQKGDDVSRAMQGLRNDTIRLENLVFQKEQEIEQLRQQRDEALAALGKLENLSMMMALSRCIVDPEQIQAIVRPVFAKQDD